MGFQMVARPDTYNLHAIMCLCMQHDARRSAIMERLLFQQLINQFCANLGFQPTVLTVALMLQCCVRRRLSSACLSVTLCIVAKRPAAKVTIDSLQEIIQPMRNRIGINQNDLDLAHVTHCVTFDAEYLGNRKRQRHGSKGPPIGNCIWAFKWSRDQILITSML